MILPDLNYDITLFRYVWYFEGHIAKSLKEQIENVIEETNIERLNNGYELIRKNASRKIEMFKVNELYHELMYSINYS